MPSYKRRKNQSKSVNKVTITLVNKVSCKEKRVVKNIKNTKLDVNPHRNQEPVAIKKENVTIKEEIDQPVFIKMQNNDFISIRKGVQQLRKLNTSRKFKSSVNINGLKFDPVYVKLSNNQKVVCIPNNPKVVVQAVITGKFPYSCQKCDEGFWTKAAYEAHAPVHILKKAKPPVKKYRCDVCLKEFSKLCDVERHTRVHTGEKPCICNICNKRFQQTHNLSKHLLTHLHIKPFVCEICNKQFGRNDVLRRHLLTHSIEKPTKCSICDKGFIRHSQLERHMKVKHSSTSKTDHITKAEGEEIK